MSELSDLDAEWERKLIGVERRDPKGVSEKLLPWLYSKIPDAEEITLPTPTTPPAGGSSELFFIDPLVRTGGETRLHQFVLRIEAADHRIYEFPSIERQYRTLDVLAKSGVTRVPAVYWMEHDKGVLGESFFVMERVDGTVPKDRYHSSGLFAEATPAAREEMWLSALAALTAIQDVDIQQLEFLRRPDLGASDLEQELAVWDSYCRWIELPLDRIQQRAQRWLHDAVPGATPPALTWGDARIPNMVFKDNACRALLDWETVSLSGAEADLGWLLFYDWFASDGHGVPRLDGIPDREATTRLWSEGVGRSPIDLHWWEVFAFWRFSIIRDHALNLVGIDKMPGVPYPDPVLRRLEELT